MPVTADHEGPAAIRHGERLGYGVRRAAFIGAARKDMQEGSYRAARRDTGA